MGKERTGGERGGGRKRQRKGCGEWPAPKGGVTSALKQHLLASEQAGGQASSSTEVPFSPSPRVLSAAPLRRPRWRPWGLIGRLGAASAA